MIVCFSGTGNSLHVARQISEQLGDEIVMLPAPKGTRIEPRDGRVIWVFPVYSWGIPPVLRRWISSMQIPGGHRLWHFAVMTCGDDCGLADDTWRSALARRGWIGREAFSVQMPNTYVEMKGFDVDSPELAAAKIAAATPRVEVICSEIQTIQEEDAWECQRYRNDVVRGKFAWVKTRVIYPWFKRFAMSPKGFHATDECISCGLCAKSCPLSNIAMANGRPQWGDNCAFCQRCYHICPRHAVAYSTATRGKGQKKELIQLTIYSIDN